MRRTDGHLWLRTPANKTNQNGLNTKSKITKYIHFSGGRYSLATLLKTGMLYYVVLCSTTLYYVVLCCTTQYYFVLCSNTLHCVVCLAVYFPRFRQFEAFSQNMPGA